MIFGLLLILLLTVAAQPPKPEEPDLEKFCKSDIEEYCSSSQNWQIYCLYQHEEKLSQSCKDYLSTTTIGGCNDEAQSMCSQFSAVGDITNCLRNHSSQLSETCLKNLNNENSPLGSAQDLNQQVTKIMTIISSVYLLVPIFIFGWAFYMMTKLHQQQFRVIKCPTSVATLPVGDKNCFWSIGFCNLSYYSLESRSIFKHLSESSTKTVKKTILHEVSGQLIGGTMTAIMGPSGSGKTTLLKLLSGQMFYGEIQGIRAINGEAMIPAFYDKIMRGQGYVPQYDVLLASLTVWQTLMYAALLRMPRKLTTEEKLKRAWKVLKEVGLSHCAHNLVGGVGTGLNVSSLLQQKSISGGQRRRLSIAMELLSDPRVILLDEPTSGLDATSSLSIVKLLSKTTKKYHSTVALTIHQPRAEVFCLFDSLILLGTGGYLIYSGPIRNAVMTLSSCPSVSLDPAHYDNPGIVMNNEDDDDSDFIIDILGLDLNVEDDDNEDISINNNDSNNKNGFATVLLSNATNPLATKAGKGLARKFSDSDYSPNSRTKEQSTALMSDIATPPYIRGVNKTIVLDNDNDDDGNHGSIHDIDQPSILNRNDITLSTSPILSSAMLTQELCKHFRQSELFKALDASFETELVRLSKLKAKQEYFSYDNNNNNKSSHNTTRRRKLTGDDTDNSMQYHRRNNSNNNYVSLNDNSTHDDSNHNNSNNNNMDIEMASVVHNSRSSNADNDDVELKQDDFEGNNNSDNNNKGDNSSPTTKYRNIHSFQAMPTVLGWADMEGHNTVSVLTYELLRITEKEPENFMTQTWILFSRRLQHTVFATSVKDVLYSVIQIMIVAYIVSVTFSYTITTTLEIPYQIVMLLAIISLYAMILQYLVLIPDYMTERPIILAEHSAGYINYWAYVFSSMLTETPRAILQSLLLMGVVYSSHSLNPEPVNIGFSLVCLIIGVCSWQSLINICSVVTDNIGYAYSIAFLILGSGTLFGGLLVRLQKIPVYFRFVYWLSVAAVTQRALVTNDLQCCYLTTTCNSLANEFHSKPKLESALTDANYNNNSSSSSSNYYCPPGLEFTGDGSDMGNLGRIYLVILGLDQERPFLSLFILFMTNVLFRILSVCILKVRHSWKYKLKSRD